LLAERLCTEASKIQASCHVMVEPYTILAQLALAEDPPLFDVAVVFT
jgi:hypothetical protein